MRAAATTKPLRVLHCPAAVGGHAPGLAAAERSLGLDARTLVLTDPPFGIDADEVLFAESASRLAREWRRWRYVLRQLRTFDVVHFNFGSTLMPRRHPNAGGTASVSARLIYNAYAALLADRDLAWLPRRTAVFVTYQGDDARQARPRFAQLGDDYFDPRVDREKRRSIARFDARADGIYALNPDLLGVLPARAEFLPYASVEPVSYVPVAPTAGGSAVVVHAPTDRRVKGTTAVVRACDALRASGIEVELVLLEGLPRDEVRRVLAGADLVVDQLITGWYGGFAVEAMAAGKPVVAHIDATDLARVPSKFATDLPIIRATTATIEDVLREWLTRRRDELPAVGRGSRDFVERWHDPRVIARTTKAAYEAASRNRAITMTSTNSPST